MQPDWTTFNGYANQYVTHPLTADPGEHVRFYVVAAGPTLDTNFHVVGTLLNRAWVNGDMSQFQRGVQTVGVPAGGGAVFDVKIDDEGSTRSSATRSRMSTSVRSGCEGRQPAGHDDPLTAQGATVREPPRGGSRSFEKGDVARSQRRLTSSPCPGSSRHLPDSPPKGRAVVDPSSLKSRRLLSMVDA
jgi:hypothetical protein